jgi:hypothetical protein
VHPAPRLPFTKNDVLRLELELGDVRGEKVVVAVGQAVEKAHLTQPGANLLRG